jgi:hypothetical protein
MAASDDERLLIEAMAKHLPPSAASLRLVDVGGRAGAILTEMRPDLDILLTPGRYDAWQLPPDSLDAVTAYDCEPDTVLLAMALFALRPGGRFILMSPRIVPDESHVKLLENGGFTRILVEPGLDAEVPVGMLLRGEKPHTEERTVDRVRQVAARDDQPAPRRSSRYVHLLIRQTPNKPAWKLKKNEKLEWNAVAVAGEGETVVLAFSSLPKAVEFMQPAVLAGYIQDVNKVAKFSWETARAWPFPIMLNPSDEIFETNAVVLLPIDPSTAEAPDE